MPPISRIRQPAPIVVALGAALVYAFAAGIAWTALSEVRAGGSWRSGGAGLFLTAALGWFGYDVARFAYRLFRMDMEPVATYGRVHRWPLRIRGRTIIGRHRSPPHELIAELGRTAARHAEIEEIYLGFLMDAAGDGVEKLVIGFVTHGDVEAAAKSIGSQLQGVIPAGHVVLIADIGRDQGLVGQHFRTFEMPVLIRRGADLVPP